MSYYKIIKYVSHINISNQNKRFFIKHCSIGQTLHLSTVAQNVHINTQVFVYLQMRLILSDFRVVCVYESVTWKKSSLVRVQNSSVFQSLVLFSSSFFTLPPSVASVHPIPQLPRLIFFPSTQASEHVCASDTPYILLLSDFMWSLNTPHYLHYFTLRFVDAKADTMQFAYICSRSLEEQ